MRGSEHRHYVAFIGRTRHSVPAVFGYGMNGGQGAARPSKRTLSATNSTGLSQRLLNRSRVLEQNPLDHGNRKAAILDQVIMELAEPETFAGAIFVAAKQIHDLPFSCDVTDFLRRT